MAMVGDAGRRRVLVRLAGLALAACAAPAASSAASAAAGGRGESPVLRAAVINLLPYGRVDLDGKVVGLFVDYFAALARESGMRIDCSVAPMARSMAQMATGEVDLMLALDSEAMSQLAEGLAVVTVGDVVLLARSGSGIASVPDLRGRTLGYVRGVYYLPELMEDAAIRRYEVANQMQGVQMLLEGRLDAMVGFRISLTTAARALGVAPGKLAAPVQVGWREMKLYYARKHRDAGVAAALQRAAAALNARGVYEGLMARYAPGAP